MSLILTPRPEVFVSLVGTQVMAVLNPMLSLGDDLPRRIVLLATKRTNDRAMTIHQYLANHKPDLDLKIVPVSSSLKRDDFGPPVSTAVLNLVVSSSADPGSMLFNLAGGMNFQVAGCVNVVHDERVRFVYPESDGVHILSVRKSEVEDSIFPLPDPLDVLRLQNIPFEPCEGRPYPSEILSQLNQTSIKIGGVSFDAMVNNGNELRFVKLITADHDEAECLILTRAVISLAFDRERFGELFHRKLAIVSDIDRVLERVDTEGGGKVLGIRIARTDPSSLRVAIHEFIGVHHDKQLQVIES